MVVPCRASQAPAEMPAIPPPMMTNCAFRRSMSGLRPFTRTRARVTLQFSIRAQGGCHMSTLLVTHPAFLAHDTGAHHPERPARLEAVLKALDRDDFSSLQ